MQKRSTLTKQFQRRATCAFFLCLLLPVFFPFLFSVPWIPFFSQPGHPSPLEPVTLPPSGQEMGAQNAAVTALCQRVLGDAVCRRVRFHVNDAEATPDTFFASSDGQVLNIYATSAVAAAFGLHQCMRSIFNLWSRGE